MSNDSEAQAVLLAAYVSALVAFMYTHSQFAQQRDHGDMSRLCHSECILLHLHEELYF